MVLRTLALSLVGVMVLFASSVHAAGAEQTKASAKTAARSNPFFTPSPLPFHAPPFDTIRDADFQPALEEGIQLQRLEVEKIPDDPAPAAFETTLVALDRSGQLLTRVNMVFNGLSSANSDPTLQKRQEEMAPKLAALHDAIFLGPRLFKRVEAIYEERATLKLDPESLRLIVWPRPLAPFEVELIALNPDAPAVRDAAEKLYAELSEAGVEVFYDDRDERPGVKFNDADLIGFPVRVVVGEKGVEQGQAELSLRRDKVKIATPLGDAVAKAKELLAGL